jgi:hypothetical protein
VAPKRLPWPATLIEEGEKGSGEFRQEDSGVGLNIECFKGGAINTESLSFRIGPLLSRS